MDGAGIEIGWVSGPDDMRGALLVREEVFCGEQGVPRSEEIDGLDGQAEHVIARMHEGREVIATLRLLNLGETAKIGRVAVRRDWRRRGIAIEMLGLALRRAPELGCRRARLAAQLEAVELYRRVGFSVESDVFQEAGIDHVWMGRALAPAAGQARSPSS